MIGTFGGALEARQIDASNGKLVGEVIGEVEVEEGVLVIRRIHVAMRITASPAKLSSGCTESMRCVVLSIAPSTTQSSFHPPTSWCHRAAEKSRIG